MFTFLISYLRTKKKLIYIYTFFYLSDRVLMLGIPYLDAVLIDSLINNSEITKLFRILGLVAAVRASSIFMQYKYSLTKVRLQSELSAKMGIDIISHIHKIPYLQIKKYKSAYLTQRINSASQELSDFALSNFLTLFETFITIMVIFFLISQVSPLLVASAAILLPLYLLIYLALKKQLYKHKAITMDLYGQYYNEYNNQFQYIRNIKIRADFENSINPLKNKFIHYLKSLIKVSSIAQLYNSLESVLNIFFYVLLYGIGGILVLRYQQISVGQLIMVLTYYQMLVGSFRYYLRFGNSYQTAKASYHHLCELTSVPTENNGAQQIEEISNIHISGLAFCYDETSTYDNYVLQGITQSFLKGKLYLVKGENGSGKSTFMDIMLGLIQNYQKGEIFVNDIPMDEIDLYTLRKKNISVMQQSLNGPDQSLKETMDFDKMIAYIKKHDLSEHYLGEGFNLIDKGGQNANDLSGGEKQKVALIYALAREPDLLILDEPTSAMDTQNTQMVCRLLSIRKEHRITIIVTHDTVFDSIADEIIYL